MSIGILSSSNDLHALAVLKELIDGMGVVAHLVPVDRLVHLGGVSYTAGPPGQATVPDIFGERVSIEAMKVLWYRRPMLPQDPKTNTPQIQHAVDRACQTSLLGAFLCCFSGTWVNDPVRNDFASNKLFQLAMASKCGLRTPRTIVSSNVDEMDAFISSSAGGRAIVKPIRGTPGVSPFARLVNSGRDALGDAPAMPNILQEYVPGTRHLRCVAFGEQVVATALDTREVDWRLDATITHVEYALTDAMRERLLHLLRVLGLRMGVFDLKLGDGDDIWWLEVNPQGQFIGVEAYTGFSYVSAFAQYLKGLCGDATKSP